MITLMEQGVRETRAPTFDPAAWLCAWSDHGGIVMLTGERLFVGRLAGIDQQAARTLDNLRCHVHQPGAGEALARALQLRSFGETAHG